MKLFLTFLFASIITFSYAQPVEHINYQDMQYRMIGPFRAGRTVGAIGIPSQPNVFYMGVNNGGVWKTDDYGRTWNPIFDKAPTGSIGDIAVSPSHPDVIYVGTGEGLHRPDLAVGDGMFKSTDGGKTWLHIGLDDVQQVGRVIVHPTNPDIVFVAGLGHPYGANDMRGVFRSVDGGATWEKVLFINHNTGAIQVEFDPTNPQVLYADMWEDQEGPWENASFSGPNSGLFKSLDGGATWHKLEKGLPTATDGLGRIGISIAPSDANILYATVSSRNKGGIYKSTDGGESWNFVAADRRLWGRGDDFAEIKVHPNNPNLVYVANVACYRSEDGGKSWTSFKGAPGGDDYHRIWINPLQPDIMIFVADQGAVITVNAGRTWSSWYNQPTSQLYHVSTDNQFPYWVYGGQQESGAIGTASRGNGGQISFRDWMGIGADEYAYVVADPKNPDILYGGRVTKFNKKTGQTQNITPEALRSGKIRFVRTLPLLFHPADPNELLFATNVLWKTTTGGQSWEIISPDLTRKQPEVPASVGDFVTEELKTMRQRAVIYAVSGSPLDKNIIWAGTDDGLVHLTRDGGKTWQDVTPPALTSWDKVSQIDAGHFDAGTAYFAINAIRKDDMRPHIYKTHDYGATWTEIVNGMNVNGPVNAAREDLKQQGLLFAGTEREVYFSIDDGANWQSLRMNMPASSIRDLVIHENDLVIGTHGRSIWILDDISPLRSMAKATQMNQPYLFEPSLATRVRFNMFHDTPLPPEEPAGQNPPDGAILDYRLPKAAQEVKLEIFDKDILVRSYSSNDAIEQLDSTQYQHPMYWLRQPEHLAVSAGHHRFIWDLCYAAPKGAARDVAISAVYKNTATGPAGPFVHPGTYTVHLTVDGATSEQAISVRLDPRVTISEEDLQLQTSISMKCYNGYLALQAMRDNIDQKMQDPKRKWKKGEKEKVAALRGSGDPENGDLMYGSISETSLDKETIVGLQGKFLFLLAVVQGADVRPTEQLQAGVDKLNQRVSEINEKYKEFKL